MSGPRFVTPLRGEKIGYDKDGRRIDKLLGELVYDSPRFGRRVIEAGFNTNYCSTPRAPVVFYMFGDIGHEPGVLHDHAYTIRDLTREEADALFLEALGAPTVIPPEFDRLVPAWKRPLMYRAVRLFGQSSWDAPSLVPQPQHVAREIRPARMPEEAAPY